MSLKLLRHGKWLYKTLRTIVIISPMLPPSLPLTILKHGERVHCTLLKHGERVHCTLLKHGERVHCTLFYIFGNFYSLVGPNISTKNSQKRKFL